MKQTCMKYTIRYLYLLGSMNFVLTQFIPVCNTVYTKTIFITI